MMSNAGFYKLDDALRYAPTAVYGPEFVLRLEQRESYVYPVNGWWYFNTESEAEEFFQVNGTSTARWVEFGNAVAAMVEVNQFLAATFQAAPALYGSLTVGLGKAADGDSRVFLAAWSQAKALGLVPVGLIAPLQALATAHGLPVEFVEAL
jgi:hypothetical protein